MAHRFKVGDTVVYTDMLCKVLDVLNGGSVYKLEYEDGEQKDVMEQELKAATYAVLTHVDTRRPLVVPTYHPEFQNIVRSPNFQLHGSMDIHAAVNMQVDLFIRLVGI